MEPVYTYSISGLEDIAYTSEEYGVTAIVTRLMRSEKGYKVTYYDDDSGATLPVFKVFDRLEDAMAEAELFATGGIA
jgi:hypothetical protein